MTIILFAVSSIAKLIEMTQFKNTATYVSYLNSKEILGIWIITHGQRNIRYLITVKGDLNFATIENIQ